MDDWADDVRVKAAERFYARYLFDGSLVMPGGTPLPCIGADPGRYVSMICQ